ncbi:CRIB domain-containing protein RIC4-like [Nicotiana tabacum]|uniref:CRIB domain-containing protein RIC4-like n=1 Tax=Nicotiana tabacum TaxID=4097 RepID=A0A1S4BA76_TOBAC|nr:PREDICTED: CRIB domain-containing protein RIC4-like [Nicotiana tabacum]
MRYRMERFVLLPFSVGCISESSVAVGHHHQLNKSPSHEPKLTPTRSQKEGKEEEREDEDDKSLEGENLKNTLGLMALPKFQRLFKNFKNLSQLFVDKEEMEEEEEEEEMGMEIGLPTDVKHVTHIGIDGASTSILSTRNWDNLKSPNDNFLTHFPLSPFAMAHSPHSPNHISMASSS